MCEGHERRLATLSEQFPDAFEVGKVFVDAGPQAQEVRQLLKKVLPGSPFIPASYQLRTPSVVVSSRGVQRLFGDLKDVPRLQHFLLGLTMHPVLKISDMRDVSAFHQPMDSHWRFVLHSRLSTRGPDLWFH